MTNETDFSTIMRRGRGLDLVLAKAPDEWWSDYRLKHREFKPWELNDEDFLRIYRYPRVERSRGDIEDPEGEEHVHKGFCFEIHFGNDFKYFFEYIGSKPDMDKDSFHSNPFYNPIVNAPG